MRTEARSAPGPRPRPWPPCATPPSGCCEPPAPRTSPPPAPPCTGAPAASSGSSKPREQSSHHSQVDFEEALRWHRDHARKALREVLRLKIVRERKARPPIYGEDVIVVLRYCWAVMGTASGKRMAPFLGDLVPVLRAFGELRIADETATAVCAMSAATIDRRLAPDRAKLQVRGRSHTKPGSLLKDSIPMRTWADWHDAVPGFVEIDLVGHEGGVPSGEHAYTLTVTDIATGWTENRSVRNKAQRWVFAALM